MSWLSQTIPILSVICLLIVDRSVGKAADASLSWTKSPNRWETSTTPWPALGQRQFHTESIALPTWVRPKQRKNTFGQHSENQHTLLNNRDKISNFTAGYDFGASSKLENLVNSDVKDDELKELSETLLTKDVNNAAKYVTINLQRKTTSRSQKDEAPLPLLSVDEQVFNIPSIERMKHLHDNYIIESNAREDYTTNEKREENNFLSSVINTPIMQYTRDFLMQKGKIGTDPNEFKNVLKEIWFDMYARGGRKVGSSGFEHVFLAEIKNSQISGLHNWLYFSEEEKNSNANYLGYLKKIDLGNKGAILKYHFVLRGIDKPVGSMFIGTSPELEMALYTTCFLTRADEICPMKLNGHRFTIRTFTYRYKGKKMIGSAFPEI